MKSKILSKRKLFIILFAGFVLSLALLFYFIQSSTRSDSTPRLKNVTTFPKQEQTKPGLPVRLIIPAINIDSAVEYVGLTPNGEMDIPKSQDNVAWYELGQRPGEKGSAVLAGHYGQWKNGRGSIFDNLYKLRKGNKIYIKDNKGENTTFVMRESRSYNPSADASDVFGSKDGKAHLNLITCEGIWNKIARSYSKRLVVFTDKE